MRRLVRGWLLALLPSLALGALVGAYPGYRFYRYAWNDPRFCFSCHVHDYATVGWRDSAHGDRTTCHDCHHQPLRAYIHEGIVMMTSRPKFPMDLHHTPYVKPELCDSCHLSTVRDLSTVTGPMPAAEVEKIPKVDRSYLHAAHLKATTEAVLLNDVPLPEEERSPVPMPYKTMVRGTGPQRRIVCADCHGGPANRAHNFSAVDLTCLRCHANVEHARANEFGCRTCHFQGFLAPAGGGPPKAQ